MSPASERESMCTSLNVLAHKTGNPKSPMNPQVSDLSDSGLSFLLLSEFWPHFSFSPMQLACLCAEDAGGLWPEAPGFHHPTSAASGVEPLSPIAPGEEEPPDPGPGHGATVTRPVCAHPGDLGLEGSGWWPHQRRRKEPVPAGGRVIQQTKVGHWADPGNRCPHPPHHCPMMR